MTIWLHLLSSAMPEATHSLNMAQNDLQTIENKLVYVQLHLLRDWTEQNPCVVDGRHNEGISLSIPGGCNYATSLSYVAFLKPKIFFPVNYFRIKVLTYLVTWTERTHSCCTSISLAAKA